MTAKDGEPRDTPGTMFKSLVSSAWSENPGEPPIPKIALASALIEMLGIGESATLRATFVETCMNMFDFGQISVVDGHELVRSSVMLVSVRIDVTFQVGMEALMFHCHAPLT